MLRLQQLARHTQQPTHCVISPSTPSPTPSTTTTSDARPDTTLVHLTLEIHLQGHLAGRRDDGLFVGGGTLRRRANWLERLAGLALDAKRERANEKEQRREREGANVRRSPAHSADRTTCPPAPWPVRRIGLDFDPDAAPVPVPVPDRRYTP